MKPTAAPAWFPYRDHRTMAQVIAGDKPSEKLIERAVSAMESGPETLRQQRPGPDQLGIGGASWL